MQYLFCICVYFFQCPVSSAKTVKPMKATLRFSAFFLCHAWGHWLQSEKIRNRDRRGSWTYSYFADCFCLGGNKFNKLFACHPIPLLSVQTSESHLHHRSGCQRRFRPSKGLQGAIQKAVDLYSLKNKVKWCKIPWRQVFVPKCDGKKLVCQCSACCCSSPWASSILRWDVLVQYEQNIQKIDATWAQ